MPTKAERSTPSYPFVALTQSGVNAAPSAGPLSFGSVRYRGFSSPQLKLLVDGYDFGDIGTGLISIYDLPWFETNRIDLLPGVSNDSIGGSLKMKLPIPQDQQARMRASFGSHGFSLVDVVAASGDFGRSKGLLGLQLASTRGDFDVSGIPRVNNDQSRAMGFLKTQHTFDSADLEFFLFGRHHDGGLAGPATFPTPDARLSSSKALFGSTLLWEFANHPMKLKWETRYDRSQSTTKLRTDDVTFLENQLTGRIEKRFQLADTYSAFESSVGQSQVLDGRFRRLSTRHELAIDTAPFSFWSMRFKRSLSIEAHSDIGWYLGFATNISAKPIDELTFGLRFGKNARPPTLSEMYAPYSLIIGNPNLEPEKLYDSSIYANWQPNPKFKLDGDLYYAHMNKAIFYVNRNSFLVEPINADHVHRAGVGLSTHFRPSELFESSVRFDWLWTEIKATGAPLPGATPISASIDARAGKEGGICLRANTVLNSGSSSNLFGTLKTQPYVLVNASLEIPILDHARLVLSATNVADVTWAKSTYLYPMPGSEFFVTLETF